MATKGGIELFSEATIFNTSNEKTNMKAKEIPSARFIPRPPLFFCEDKDNAKKVRIIIETGIAVR